MLFYSESGGMIESAKMKMVTNSSEAKDRLERKDYKTTNSTYYKYTYNTDHPVSHNNVRLRAGFFSLNSIVSVNSLSCGCKEWGDL